MRRQWNLCFTFTRQESEFIIPVLWSVSQLFCINNFSIPLDYDLKKHIRIQRDKRTTEELWRRWETEQVIFGISKQFIGWADLSRAPEIWLQLHNDKAACAEYSPVISAWERIKVTCKAIMNSHLNVTPCQRHASLWWHTERPLRSRPNIGGANYIFNSVTFSFNAIVLKSL